MQKIASQGGYSTIPRDANGHLKEGYGLQGKSLLQSGDAPPPRALVQLRDTWFQAREATTVRTICGIERAACCWPCVSTFSGQTL